MAEDQFKIDLTEKFPLLSKAPIAEAVVEMRAAASILWGETELRQYLAARLKEYSKIKSAKATFNQVQFAPDRQPRVTSKDLGWQGLICTTDDGKQIAKFQRQSFSFSRLRPYGDWERFRSEALRLWKIHSDFAKPSELMRLGLRYINQISLDSETAELRDYFNEFSLEIKGLDPPVSGFLHQDTLATPDNRYGMNIIRSIQRAAKPGLAHSALILDIDVSTAGPVENSEEAINTRLSEMRWLKNKIFFGIMNENLITKLK